MNEALRKELTGYFWSGSYTENGTALTGADTESSKVLSDMKGSIGDKLYFDYESQLCNAFCEHELEGFLRGYMYCLTMLGMNNEKALSQRNA